MPTRLSTLRWRYGNLVAREILADSLCPLPLLLPLSSSNMLKRSSSTTIPRSQSSLLSLSILFLFLPVRIFVYMKAITYSILAMSCVLSREVLTTRKIINLTQYLSPSTHYSRKKKDSLEEEEERRRWSSVDGGVVSIHSLFLNGRAATRERERETCLARLSSRSSEKTLKRVRDFVFLHLLSSKGIFFGVKMGGVPFLMW